MKPKLILCLARGFVYTFALLMPYALFIAWVMTGTPAANGAAKPPLWLELSLGALQVALNLFLRWWYFTIPLALVIAAAFYLRQQLKSRTTETSKP